MAGNNTSIVSQTADLLFLMKSTLGFVLCFFNRFITVMAYLNDVEEGGETAFPTADNATYDSSVSYKYNSLQSCIKYILANENTSSDTLQSCSLFQLQYSVVQYSTERLLAYIIEQKIVINLLC